MLMLSCVMLSLTARIVVFLEGHQGNYVASGPYMAANRGLKSIDKPA